VSDLLEYADQSARDLQFYLLTGTVDVSHLTVLCEYYMNWGSTRVRFGILGASHFVTVDTADGCTLNEIFACTKLDTDRPTLMSGPLGTLSSSVRSCIGAIRYEFYPSLVSWDEGEALLNEIADLIHTADKPNQKGLSFDFPCHETDTRVPRTLVLVETVDTRLITRTVHSYPSEDEIVFTTSIVDLKK